MNQIDNIMALHHEAAKFRAFTSMNSPATLEADQALRAAIEQALSARGPDGELAGYFKQGEFGAWIECSPLSDGAQAFYAAPQPQPKQEAVGEVLNERGEVDYLSYAPELGTKLYTAPQPQLTLETAPPGTKAPSFGGGAWMKTERGWQWNGGTRSPGSTFPRPGGDWDGRLIAPQPQPQREWVGLTDEEIDGLDYIVEATGYCSDNLGVEGTKDFARAIEAKLREKNT